MADGWMFQDRKDAAKRLAYRLRSFDFRDPLVLGIPRGGVVTAATLATELDADLDVVIARKLRHPNQPELAIGAVSEDGEVFLPEDFSRFGVDNGYIQGEVERQTANIEQRRRMFRGICPQAPIAGRSVILTDDGIATGSTMFAALAMVKAKAAHQTIVAVPVAPPAQLEQLRGQCDVAIAVLLPDDFMAIGQFYRQFEQVDDESVCEVLRQFADARAHR